MSEQPAASTNASNHSDNPGKLHNDSETTLKDVRRLVDDFVTERDWHQFHSPKNLAMSLAIETSELMEHFQWISMDESRTIKDQPEKLAEVASELADVFSYALAIANELEIDIADAIFKKMQKNRQKYPVKEFKGKYGKS